MLFIFQLSVGSLLRIVLIGKMAGAQVFAFCLFLILTVHGSEVGKPAWIAFSRASVFAGIVVIGYLMFII